MKKTNISKFVAVGLCILCIDGGVVQVQMKNHIYA